jgi:imidazolonepropionase-like amidohydrolase
MVENGIVNTVSVGTDACNGEVIDASGMIITPGWVDSHAYHP